MAVAVAAGEAAAEGDARAAAATLRAAGGLPRTPQSAAASPDHDQGPGPALTTEPSVAERTTHGTRAIFN